MGFFPFVVAGAMASFDSVIVYCPFALSIFVVNEASLEFEHDRDDL